MPLFKTGFCSGSVYLKIFCLPLEATDLLSREQNRSMTTGVRSNAPDLAVHKTIAAKARDLQNRNVDSVARVRKIPDPCLQLQR